MNEEINTRIVKEGYGHFESGNIAALLDSYADNIEWSTPPIEGAPFSGVHNGLDEVKEFFTQLDGSEEFTHFEPTEFIAQDDRVVVLGKSAATIKATGRSFETDWIHIFTVKDGKVTNFLEFLDTAGAERAYQKASAV